jgi:hypothetical protein
MKLVRPIKINLNKIYANIHKGKRLTNAFPIQYGLKQEGARCLRHQRYLSTLLLNFSSEYFTRELKKI